MLKGFKTKELVFLAIIGVLMFIADSVIAAPITAAIGISGTGGIASTLFWTLILTVGALSVRKFGSFTLMHFIYGFLVMFTPVTLLPPLLKILAFTLQGFVTDLLVAAFKYKKVGYYSGIVLAQLFFMVEFYLLYVWLGIPTTSQVGGAKYLLILIPLVTFVVCALGVFFGYKVYDRIKYKRFMRHVSY